MNQVIHLKILPMKTLLTLLFIAASLNSSAQNYERKHSFQLGFTFSYLPETILSTIYEADLQFHANQFYGFGFSGMYYIGEKFAMETGISLSRYTIGYDDMNSDHSGVMNTSATEWKLKSG
ncbi:MAG TPA: hypothetical protein VK179_11715 [Bacteroidales bacterium]|nr:hypothetical protein [Bacteroidales bacterium]